MVYYQKCLFISKHTDSTYIDTDGKIHTSTKALYCTNHTHKHTQLWSFVERLCKPAEWTEERWVKWKTVIDRQLYWTWSLLSKCSHVLPILFIGRCIWLKIIKNMLKHIKMHYCYLGIMKNLKSWIRVGGFGGLGDRTYHQISMKTTKLNRKTPPWYKNKVGIDVSWSPQVCYFTNKHTKTTFLPTLHINHVYF